MLDFRVSVLQDTSILSIYWEREFIELDPDYQRLSDVWTLEKKQLLIDSILNGFDIPKIYFHEFINPKKIDGKLLKYAIVDGKQRLQTIWKFINGEFPLSQDFQMLNGESIDAAGLTYGELANKFPKLKNKFDGKTLSIISIQTDEIDLIEEMFSRLNEAVPLNAPEKRNAFGGPIPKFIKSIATHNLFKEKIPFPDKRYRYLDVSVKFLFLETVYTRKGSRIFDTKKVFLDDFVKRPNIYLQERTIEDVEVKTNQVLDLMTNVFVNKDKLLKSTGTLAVYYLLFREYGERVNRRSLEDFETLRLENRDVETDEDLLKAKADLLEFDRLSRSPNDFSSIIYRFDVLAKYIFGKDYEL